MGTEQTEKASAMPHSVRLTSEIRDKVRAQLIATKFAKREAALKDARAELAMSVYEQAFSAEDRRKMNRLPDGWMYETKVIGARFGGEDFSNELPKGRAVRIPAEKMGRYYSVSYLLAIGAGEPLSKRHAELERERNDIAREKRDLIRDIDAVLFSVTTANRLVAVWPEISKTVEAIAKTYIAGTNLPAPRVDHLNKVLGFTKAA